jgi:hypothetical protein
MSGGYSIGNTYLDEVLAEIYQASDQMIKCTTALYHMMPSKYNVGKVMVFGTLLVAGGSLIVASTPWLSSLAMHYLLSVALQTVAISSREYANYLTNPTHQSILRNTAQCFNIIASSIIMIYGFASIHSAVSSYSAVASCIQENKAASIFITSVCKTLAYAMNSTRGAFLENLYLDYFFKHQNDTVNKANIPVPQEQYYCLFLLKTITMNSIISSLVPITNIHMTVDILGKGMTLYITSTIFQNDRILWRPQEIAEKLTSDCKFAGHMVQYTVITICSQIIKGSTTALSQHFGRDVYVPGADMALASMMIKALPPTTSIKTNMISLVNSIAPHPDAISEHSTKQRTASMPWTRSERPSLGS